MAGQCSKLVRTLAVIDVGLGAGTGTAQAAPVLIGTFSGNECGGAGGFSNCYAYQNGTTGQGQTGGGSPAIFKYNSDGSTDRSTLFPSITGAEFTVGYEAGNNTLSFTYTAGAADPVVHYFALFQANQTRLFYDAAPITSGSVALSSYFPNNPGYSHITFFDTGATPSVPEPATWAVMLVGFAGTGYTLRRRRAIPRCTA